MLENKLHIRYVVAVALLLTACTRADIHYPADSPLEGVVQIRPDVSEHTLPSAEYYFYNTDGETECIVRSCDGSGNFEGKLPLGAYRVIATNTSAFNVEFSNMHAYGLATVCAKPQTAARMAWPSGRAASTLSFLEQPDDVYSTVVEELVVTADAVVRKEPAPVLLTKRLNLAFSMQSGLGAEVTAMSGVLPGVYSAVHLCNGQSVQAEQNPETLAVRFDTEEDDTQRTAQVSLFGLCDPAYGDNYTNQLELELTMADGSTAHTTLDLTAILSEKMEENDGSIPVDVSISIEVAKTDTGIGVKAEVIGWIEEGENVIENE